MAEGVKYDVQRLDGVRERVQFIREHALDNEVAHDAEDALYRTVLQLIAAGRCPDPVTWAREALRAREIEFDRWTA